MYICMNVSGTYGLVSLLSLPVEFVGSARFFVCPKASPLKKGQSLLRSQSSEYVSRQDKYLDWPNKNTYVGANCFRVAQVVQIFISCLWKSCLPRKMPWPSNFYLFIFFLCIIINLDLFCLIAFLTAHAKPLEEPKKTDTELSDSNGQAAKNKTAVSAGEEVS